LGSRPTVAMRLYAGRHALPGAPGEPTSER
jgi:hypothetical protein